MSVAQYDVVVVGAGGAGLCAAIGLARAGFTVAVVEAAPVPGGANDLGGVCFAESLAQPEILGEEGVAALAWERRLIERGIFATDGRRLTGYRYRDPAAFRDGYTVLRPLFEHHLAQMALLHGIALVTATTVESLIRDGRRVIGVATTRGPLYGDLVFLAEGDAGQLVSREGLDRSRDPRDTPDFLYGLQQVIELPPGAIEERFRVGPEQGVVFDVLLRNRGPSRLNLRGHICTNRQSLTLGVVLPAEHLRRYFDGEPRQLLNRFADMPVLIPWLRDGRRGAWTARLVRAGGLRDVPYLVEDGLVVGGAATGLGVDFPAWNLAGPALFTGLQLTRAARRIRAEGGDFSRAALQRHYLEPLQASRYWKDRAFLQRWPGYLKHSRVLFDRELDLLLDSASVWTRPRRWLPRKLLGWLLMLARVPWSQWGDLQQDAVALGRALRLHEVTPRPGLGRVVLDGALNAFRDLARQPRPHLPPGGELHLTFDAAGESHARSTTPALLRRWFQRFRPVLASAGHILYQNDDMPLSAKLTRMIELLARQINLLDLLALTGVGVLLLLASLMRILGGYLLHPLHRPGAPSRAGETVEPAGNFPGEQDRPIAVSARTELRPDIHFVSKTTPPLERAEAARSLPHVCPTGVFELRGAAPETVDVVVRAERCIQCEACWRINPSVDWGRGAFRRWLSPVPSPVVMRLLQAEDRAGLVRPALPRHLNPWNASAAPVVADAGPGIALLAQLDHKLAEFDGALANGPALVDHGRSDHLEMLARYAHQLALGIAETLPGGDALAAALVAKLEERTRRTWDCRFAWAAADGRQVRQHHLTGLRRLLGDRASAERFVSRASPPSVVPALPVADAARKHQLADDAARRQLLETLDQATALGEVPARVELLTALRDEVRAGLAGQYTLPGSAEAIYRRQEPRLLADVAGMRTLLDVPGDWPTLMQRRALSAEREEIQEAENRLLALAEEEAEGAPSAREELSIGFARQAAYVLAGKWLLLGAHAGLEAGRDSQLTLVLLRVWLDNAATLRNEFALALHLRRQRGVPAVDRPLIEPGSGPPPRTRAQWQEAAAPYTTGDFLLAPIDLLQPRLVPEMPDAEAEAIASLLPEPQGVRSGSKEKTSPAAVESAAQLLQLLHRMRERPQRPSCPEEGLYIAEALALDVLGRCMHNPAPALALERAGARLILTDLLHGGGALQERCAILRALADEVMPRRAGGGAESMVRHLGREVLELEALKAEFRRRLIAAWDVFGVALGRNDDVQASCFALAEAAAWLQAADSTLGRLAWLSRLCQAEERDEPTRLERGRRALAHCDAEVRDRLHRFDEDLASLRRGYYAPHVRAAALLSQLQPQPSAAPPASDINTSLRVLVVVEPLPAVVSQSPDDGEDVLESVWVLGDADRSALEAALRLRDAAPECVSIAVAALGPPRVAQALREVISLGIGPVCLVVEDGEELTPERAAAALAAKLAPSGPFDLLLGGDTGARRGKRLAPLVAGSLGLLLAGHAGEVAVQASAREANIRLMSAASPVARERALPAAVLIEPGFALRPFTMAGYLAGLDRTVEIVPV